MTELDAGVTIYTKTVRPQTADGPRSRGSCCERTRSARASDTNLTIDTLRCVNMSCDNAELPHPMTSTFFADPSSGAITCLRPWKSLYHSNVSASLYLFWELLFVLCVMILFGRCWLMQCWCRRDSQALLNVEGWCGLLEAEPRRGICARCCACDCVGKVLTAVFVAAFEVGQCVSL
jgi:hypothetical protein